MILTANREVAFKREWRIGIRAREIATLNMIRFGMKTFADRSRPEL